MAAVTQDRPTRFGLVTGLTFVGALAIALVARGTAVVGIRRDHVNQRTREINCRASTRSRESDSAI